MACGNQQVGLHHVIDKPEVATDFAVAVGHVDELFGDDGGVGAVGVLAWAENVEVTLADDGQFCRL